MWIWTFGLKRPIHRATLSAFLIPTSAYLSQLALASDSNAQFNCSGQVLTQGCQELSTVGRFVHGLPRPAPVASRRGRRSAVAREAKQGDARGVHEDQAPDTRARELHGGVGTDLARDV